MKMHDDSGVVAVVVALTATLLFAFGAFAVDLGAAYSERRSSQTSADAAALAGANALPEMGGSTSDAIRDARAYVETNLATPEGGWNAGWDTCVDAGHLAITNAIGGQCISVSSYGTRVRVVIPRRLVPTTLASAMGITSITVSATAEAQIEYSFSANVLPFGIPPSAGSSSEACLKSGATGTAVLTETCDGSDAGNFGTLEFTHFGAAGPGTITQCTGQTRDRLTRNVILGIDHAVSTISTRPSLLADRPACEQGADHGSKPNGTTTQTGGPDIQQALVSGVSNDKNVHRDLEGRLAQSVSVAGWPMDQVQSGEPLLDNQPLWSLIDPAAASAAGLPACDPANIAAATPPSGDDRSGARRDAMAACLQAARTTTTPLFTVDSDSDGIPDLAESKRFAFVPMVDAEFGVGPGGTINGNQTVYFVRLVPVYLESVLWSQCHGKDYIFRPDPNDNLTMGGHPTTGLVPGNCKADALTGLIIPDAALPTWITENAPGTSGTPQVVLNR